MDTTYDMGRLNFEEMLELRELQAKMQDETAAQAWPRHVGADVEYTRLTLEELLRLEDLYYKMAGQENPHKHATPAYVTVIGREFTDAPDSGEAAASFHDIHDIEVKPVEPVAVAPAAAPAKPSDPATPAPADKPHKLPADHVATALHQLDGIMRFGA